MKKVFSLILALGLIASLTACGGGNASGNETGDSAPTASTAKLRFVTGGESGTYYAFGSVIAQHAKMCIRDRRRTGPPAPLLEHPYGRRPHRSLR